MPLSNSNNESWTQGLTGLADRSAEYYKQVRTAAAMLVGAASCPEAPHAVGTRQFERQSI